MLEDVDNGEGIVSLMFLEFADAADRYFFLARAVKADAGEGLLGVAFDGAGWVFEGACIHKRIRVELDYFENITYMNQKKEGVDEKEKTRAAVFIETFRKANLQKWSTRPRKKYCRAISLYASIHSGSS